jgi:hypothetical protein
MAVTLSGSIAQPWRARAKAREPKGGEAADLTNKPSPQF